MDKDLKDLLSLLNAEDAEYLVIGSYALTLHAQPRYTKDLDIWVGFDSENAERVYRVLHRFGAPLAGVLEPSDLKVPGTVFHMGVAPNRIDILTSAEGLVFAQAWLNRLPWNVDEEVLTHCISVEDFIRNKTAVGRLQDLADIEAVERAQKQRGD